ncbi:Zona pellucida domain-containing protein [Strongyloides ratti]|uniref:Zona pellucida domain-containing protein n=1 Tax=Strongyloides ratti TaxID=34506 RepID=A0A090MYJ4_STRRB|nr:Zona pellucida domain-containing protein [Strongyloides ratti]CEF67289.1 Zona pellucida domain-containing protein [Strongyloides ratti]
MSSDFDHQLRQAFQDLHLKLSENSSQIRATDQLLAQARHEFRYDSLVKAQIMDSGKDKPIYRSIGAAYQLDDYDKFVSGSIRNKKFFSDIIFNKANDAFGIKTDIDKETEVSKKSTLKKYETNEIFLHDHNSMNDFGDLHKKHKYDTSNHINEKNITYFSYDKFFKRRLFENIPQFISATTLRYNDEMSNETNKLEEFFFKNHVENSKNDGLVFMNSPPKLNNHFKESPKSVCLENGTIFSFETMRPFTGKVFISEKKNNTNCYFNFKNAPHPKIYFYYKYCSSNTPNDISIKNNTLNINVVFNKNKTPQLLYKVKCPKMYGTPVKNIHLADKVNTFNIMKLYKTFPTIIPSVEFKVIKNHISHEVNKHTKNDKLQFLWSLKNSTDIYNFLITNCIIVSKNQNYTIIDKHGCSVDDKILSHPQYNILKKTISSKFLPFNITDTRDIKIQYNYRICTTSKDNNELSSCDKIGLPPICPII